MTLYLMEAINGFEIGIGLLTNGSNGNVSNFGEINNDEQYLFGIDLIDFQCSFQSIFIPSKDTIFEGSVSL